MSSGYTRHLNRHCDLCGRQIPVNKWESHRHSCKQRPSDDELRRMFRAGVSYAQLGRDLNVSRTIVRSWFTALGLAKFKMKPGSPRMRKGVQPPDGDHIRPLADLQYAPMRGIYTSGCHTCDKLEECQRRQALELWPLCCIPTRHEVALAYRDGRIGHDDNMPDWLPELVKELIPHG